MEHPYISSKSTWKVRGQALTVIIDTPMMAVFKDKCLVVLNQGKKGQFIGNEQEKLQASPQFNFDTGKPLVNVLLIENQYVIAVYETNV